MSETSKAASRYDFVVYQDTTVTTSVTPTTTIATSSGFTPLGAPTTINYVSKRTTEERRGRIAVRAPQKQVLSIQNGKAVFSPALYPSSVRCGALVNVFKTSTITKTAATVSTITAPTPISTTTVTSISTSTSTITPVDAGTTVFTTVGVTSISQTTLRPVTTVTSTSTATVLQPAATSYAACAANNMVSGINGQGFSDFAAVSPVQLLASNAQTAYDCCVQSQMAGGSYGYVWSDDRGCVLSGPGNAAPGQCGAPVTGAYYMLGGELDPSTVAGNGPCGGWQFEPSG
ncbi:hypothetical protein MBLNU457_g0685t1 [Dothideomycetes sp. NU457]